MDIFKLPESFILYFAFVFGGWIFTMDQTLKKRRERKNNRT